jgi:hypothetical protein
VASVDLPDGEQGYMVTWSPVRRSGVMPHVTFRCEMAIGALGLLDRGVPELILHPTEIRSLLKHPGRVAVSHSVGLPVRQLRGGD